jgi:hypothetical protein
LQAGLSAQVYISVFSRAGIVKGNVLYMYDYTLNGWAEMTERRFTLPDKYSNLQFDYNTVLFVQDYVPQLFYFENGTWKEYEPVPNIRLPRGYKNVFTGAGSLCYITADNVLKRYLQTAHERGWDEYETGWGWTPDNDFNIALPRRFTEVLFVFYDIMGVIENNALTFYVINHDDDEPEPIDIPVFPLPEGYTGVYSKPYPLLLWLGVEINNTVQFYVYNVKDNRWDKSPDKDFIINEH